MYIGAVTEVTALLLKNLIKKQPNNNIFGIIGEVYMKDKDITQKMLEKYNDVFADILNVLLFDGKDVVAESSLSDALPMSMLKIGSSVRLQERDIAKYWQNSKINLSLFGLENQTRPDNLMPLRVFGYDGSEYVN